MLSFTQTFNLYTSLHGTHWDHFHVNYMRPGTAVGLRTWQADNTMDSRNTQFYNILMKKFDPNHLVRLAIIMINCLKGGHLHSLHLWVSFSNSKYLLAWHSHFIFILIKLNYLRRFGRPCYRTLARVAVCRGICLKNLYISLSEHWKYVLNK